MWILFILLLSCSSILAKNEDYMGYQIYDIKLVDETHQENFHKIKSDGIDFLRKPCVKYNITGKALVAPSHIPWFEEMLTELWIKKEVAVTDVYEYLKTEELKSSTRLDREEILFNFKSYHKYDVILEHLYSLQTLHENSAISFEVVTYSVTQENRPIVYIKLSAGNDDDKPIAIIEAGINPREWITVSSALNIANRLLEDEQRYLLNQMTWIIVPVSNPDGYEYTHTNLRLWSKSRSLNSHLGFICPGVNINRNFDIDWLVSDSSSSPCSHLYAGVEAFSEIETSFLRNLIDSFKPKLYISLQNNGNFITFPWRYEKAASGLFRQHYLLGLDMVSSLKGYVLDSGAIAFGDRESGTSTDYARMNGVFYTYNIGVEGTGDDGVIVAEEEIEEVTENVWRAVKIAAEGTISRSQRSLQN